MVYYVLLYLKLEKGEISMKKIWFIIALALVISAASYGMKTIASQSDVSARRGRCVCRDNAGFVSAI